ncbi:MAG TPA: hypothetical protein PKD64_07295 [Pirellulaceae bacterium]|nr:hypothetical protein [Pirellulaceae bacterium]HMO91990.1 hypothetical protein [Pirellulaceae bacterium]HMP68789.1 hypothetical protein [Pirellulaceae bacterium]
MHTQRLTAILVLLCAICIMTLLVLASSLLTIDHVVVGDFKRETNSIADSNSGPSLEENSPDAWRLKLELGDSKPISGIQYSQRLHVRTDLIKRLYELGAESVLVEQSELPFSLSIRLPDDATVRQAILDYLAKELSQSRIGQSQQLSVVDDCVVVDLLLED